MEWNLEDGKSVQLSPTVADIKAAVQGLMDSDREFLILTPPAPIKGCNFMQLMKHDDSHVHFEISILKPDGGNRIYYQEFSPHLANALLELFRVENGVPEVDDWKIEGEYGG